MIPRVAFGGLVTLDYRTGMATCMKASNSHQNLLLYLFRCIFFFVLVRASNNTASSAVHAGVSPPHTSDVL